MDNINNAKSNLFGKLVILLFLLVLCFLSTCILFFEVSSKNANAKDYFGKGNAILDIDRLDNGVQFYDFDIPNSVVGGDSFIVQFTLVVSGYYSTIYDLTEHYCFYVKQDPALFSSPSLSSTKFLTGGKAGDYTFAFTLPDTFVNRGVLSLYFYGPDYGELYYLGQSASYNYYYVSNIKLYNAGTAELEVYNNGYNNGYDTGYDTGYGAGEAVGYTDGLSDGAVFEGTALGALGGIIGGTVNLFTRAFDTIGNLNVFGITIWSLLGIVIAFGLVMLVLKIIRG